MIPAPKKMAYTILESFVKPRENLEIVAVTICLPPDERTRPRGVKNAPRAGATSP